MYVIIKLYLNRSYILDIIEPYLYPIYTLFIPYLYPIYTLFKSGTNTERTKGISRTNTGQKGVEG